MSTIPADGLHYERKFGLVLASLTVQGARHNTAPDKVATSTPQRRQDVVVGWKRVVGAAITPEVWATWPSEHQGHASTVVQDLVYTFREDKITKGTPEEVAEALHMISLNHFCWFLMCFSSLRPHTTLD
ncbi:hypothetical protein JCM11641_002180 [Rhodosporidiobolus odoratus]